MKSIKVRISEVYINPINVLPRNSSSAFAVECVSDSVNLSKEGENCLLFFV